LGFFSSSSSTWRIVSISGSTEGSDITNLLDLGLLVLALNDGLLLGGDLGLNLLGGVEVDGVRDELGVLLHDLLDLGLLEVLLETVLDVEDDLGAASDSGTLLVDPDGEGTTGAGLPDVLLCKLRLAAEN
jgi:hypothetical protein